MSYLPFIVVPPFTSCSNSFIIFGQGTAPYNIFPIASGANNNTISLEAIPLQLTSGYLDWKVDFDAGANITWALIDGAGNKAYSQYRVVQSNPVGTTCPKTIYTTPSPSSNTGAIIGGAVGGILVLLLILAGVLTYFKRKRMTANGHYDDSSINDDEPEMTGTGATGVRRAGTFNLHNVQFTDTEASRQALEAPPSYVAPKRHFFSNRSSRATTNNGSDIGTSASVSGSRRTSVSQSIREEVENPGASTHLNSSTGTREEINTPATEMEHLTSPRIVEDENVGSNHVVT